MRTRTHFIRFAEWFPPQDIIATVVARLCILRQDYFLELQGIAIRGAYLTDDKGLEQLDENSSEWRRMYFYRNSLRTLFEIRNTVEALFNVKEQKEASSKESPKLQEAFQKLRRQMTKAAELVKRLRHDIGGHVQHKAVLNALDNMAHGSGGFYQRGELLGKTHYKFSSELMLAIMLPGVAEDALIPELENMLGQTAKLIPVVGTIDEVVRSYINARRLYCP